MIDFTKVFDLASDVMNDLPDIEKSVATAQQIITALEAKQMPQLTQVELDQFKADVADLEKLISDIKALVP